MKSTNCVINIRWQSFAAVCLLSLLIFNSALGTSATDKLSQESSALNNEIDFDPTLMPSPEQVIAADTPAPSKPKARKAALSDPRGFSSTPYPDTKPGKSEGEPSSAKTESEPRERLRPELHGAPPTPWYRKFYIRFDLGEDTPKKGKGITFKHSAMWGLGVGHQLAKAFRLDLNLQSRKFRTNKSVTIKSIQHKAVFLNGYYNLMETNSIISPYLTAGLGIGLNNPKGIVTRDSSGNLTLDNIGIRSKDFIWNVGVGANFSLHHRLKLEAGYKYIDFSKFKSYTRIMSSVPRTIIVQNKSKLSSHEFVCAVIFNL